MFNVFGTCRVQKSDHSERAGGRIGVTEGFDRSNIREVVQQAYDLVIEGESYRPRLKPRLGKDGKERTR